MVCCRKLVYIRAAGPLTVTVLSIAICNIFHLNRAPYNIKVVGTVPAVSPWPPCKASGSFIDASQAQDTLWRNLEAAKV